jgi:hypothetical protein
MSHTTTIAVQPAEEGTAVITASFTDETGDAVAPNAGTLTWTLTTRLGAVVNNRSAVAITSAASVTVVLTGDDLDITTYGVGRVITFQGLYNSSLGNNLPIKLQGFFIIEDMVAVS